MVSSRSRIRRARGAARVALILIAVAALAGCVHQAPGPEVAPDYADQAPLPAAPPLAPVPYEESVGYPDLSPVAGRVICIDPGHGGPWPGAVAPSNRLRESDLNLAVSLRLRDILEAAGAQVILTRGRDVALDPSALGADLSARPAMAHAASADVFVSVHHNATAGGGDSANNLEVYYKLGEDGPSLDLGQCLTESLARWLRQDQHAKRLLPGNYRVLRDARIPAVLLESFYLTAPQSAAALAKPEMQEKEARAIAAGLARYFSLDPPRNVVVEPRERDGGRLHELAVRYDGKLPIDPGSVRVYVNDLAADGLGAPGAPGQFSWLFGEPLPNGVHTLRLTARNTAGAALAVNAVVSIERPPAQLRIRQRPESPTRGAGILFLYEVEALDVFGRPVADGTPVTFVGRTGQINDGVARFYIPESELPETLRAECGAAYAETAPVFGTQSVSTARCISAQDGRPVHAAAIWTGEGAHARTTPEGWFAVPARFNEVRVAAPGYRTATARLAGGFAELPLEPIAGGVLQGKRIVLDPVGGGRSPGAVGPTGYRASDAAVDVARRAAALLREAGAIVELTREGDEELAVMQRVGTVHDADAEIAIILAYGAEEAGPGRSVAHYPGSDDGTRLAALLAAQFSVGMRETSTLVVQQTPCPTAILQPYTVADADGERAARNPVVRHEDAQRIFNAVAGYFGAP